MRGIVLAGGFGTRLWPMTMATSKQLLPIYDKPLVYYPLSVLLLCGIREILVISTPQDLPSFEKLLGDGSRFGCCISYKAQSKPEGLAQAFILGEEFIGDQSVAMVLGDNLFYGNGLVTMLKSVCANFTRGAEIFAYQVSDPNRYGIVELDGNGKAVSLEEKPRTPKSNYAITGLYFYDSKVAREARRLLPSARGELEITDLNNVYLQKGELQVTRMGRGITWLDTGTPRTLLEASSFVHTIQERQGLMVACLEEIAFENGWLDRDSLSRIAASMGKSPYADYLMKLGAD